MEKNWDLLPQLHEVRADAWKMSLVSAQNVTILDYYEHEELY